MTHKILFISDIHFGVKGNSESFLTIIENFFLKKLSSVIKEKQITDVRILGDLFDNRNTLNVRTVNTVIKIFRWYQDNFPSVRWKILTGNHDTYYHNRLDINSVEMLREFPNIEIITSVTTEILKGKKIITFPWIIKESETDTKFHEIAKGDEIYDLCLGHFEINGFEVTFGLNHEGGVDSGYFKNYKRVFTGHFHLRRTSNHITYLGCPYQITWGDYGDEKGIHIYDIETEEVEFIPNNESPVFVKINIQDLFDRNTEKLKKVKDNFVKLIIDKKYTDQIIIKVINKLESLEPRRLDVDNQYIEDFNGEEVELDDTTKLNDPLAFLLEYIKNLDDVDIDKNDFSDYVGNLYKATLKEDN